MAKHLDRPIPKPTRPIFMANGEYYFYDEDCFGHSIQDYEWPITADQILAASISDKMKSGALIVSTAGLAIVRSSKNNEPGIIVKVKVELRDKEIIEDLKKEVENLKSENKALRKIIGAQ